MPKQVTLLRVFAASPGDVPEERAILEQIINELNIMIGSKQGILIELVKWETHAYPSIGEDTQSVIREQIGEEYDVFIGILWKRFGTPTNRAQSGTAEEFNQAYQRFKKNPDSIRIMFYFNECPVSPSELDPRQLSLIQEFRNLLGEKGALYWTYTKLDEFERLVRLHLSQHISDFGKTWGQIFNESKPKIKDVIEQNSDTAQKLTADEDVAEGFLDLVETGVASFKANSEVSNRVTSLLKDLSEKLVTNTEKMRLLSPDDTKQRKHIIDEGAEGFEYFAERMDVEIPIFAKTYRSGIDAYIGAVQLMLDFDDITKTDIMKILELLVELRSTFIKSHGEAKKFKDTIRGLPRMTTKLNRAKKRTSEVLDKYLDELMTAINLTTEAEKAYENILSEFDRVTVSNEEGR